MKKLLLVLLALLLCVGAVGCASAEELNDTENHDDAAPDDTSEPQKTTKTVGDWLLLPGVSIDFPDLNVPVSPEEATGGDYPHFCGEVVEATVDYLVVKPDATLNDVRYDHLVPYTEEMLKHADSYVVPLATKGQGVIAANEFSVGDLVCVHFGGSAIRCAEYGASPVASFVIYCSLLQSE